MALRSLVLALTLLATMPAAAQTIDSVAPELLRRGATTEVIVRGESLGATTGAIVDGTGLTISGLEATDDLVRFEVGVGATADLGLRDLTLTGVDLEVGDALEVVAGNIEILSVGPTEGSRGESLTLDVRGSNLDTITNYDFGDGIEVTGWTSPSATSGTVSITIDESAFAGARPVSGSRVGDEFTLFGGFTVRGGAPTFIDLLPPRGVRGETVELRLEGTNLDSVDSISLGSRVTIESFTIESPTIARASVSVREDASAGARDVSLRYDDGETVTGERAFNVRRGEISVLQLRPDRVRQGDETFLTVEGLNLDGATSFDAGEGVVVTGIDADFPTSVSVDVSIALDAPTGFRDVIIEAPAGTIVVEDALIIGDFVPPLLDISIPVEFDLGEVQIGTYGRGGLTVENRGELPETVEIIGVDGDIDLFALLDENDERTNRVSFELGVGERRDIIVEFTPDLRGRTGVEYAVTARGGDEVGTTIVRATGTRQELLWGPEPPFDFGEHPAGERVQLQRLDTDLRDGVPSRQTLVIGWELRATLDGNPINNDELLTVDFQSTIGTGELFWGTTEVSVTVQGAAGSYEGELLLLTDTAAASIVPFDFFLTLSGDVVPDGEPTDVGPDTGADVGPDTDGGTPDTGSDTPATDSGVDQGVDTPGTDTGGTDTASDVSGDSSTDTGGGGGGCCSTASSNPPSPAVAVFVMLGLALVRRRR